jgi:hypothetical protein
VVRLHALTVRVRVPERVRVRVRVRVHVRALTPSRCLLLAHNQRASTLFHENNPIEQRLDKFGTNFASGTRYPFTRNSSPDPKLFARPETQNSSPETRSSKPKSRPETLEPKPKTLNPKPYPLDLKPQIRRKPATACLRYPKSQILNLIPYTLTLHPKPLT